MATEPVEGGIACRNPADYEPIIRFIEQPAIIDTVAAYMGEVPVIANVGLLYTPVNDLTIGSQQFHRDMNHPSSMHMIVLIGDVDEGSAPSLSCRRRSHARLPINCITRAGGFPTGYSRTVPWFAA